VIARAEVLALLVLLASCGPSTGRRASPRVDPKQRPASVAAFAIYFADGVSPLERQQAEAAIRHHWSTLGTHVFYAAGFHLGASYPSGSFRVVVHPGVTLGSPYMAPIPGRYDATTRTVHVVIGPCGCVPDFIHAATHAFYAPREDHALAPVFWSEVLRYQDLSVTQLRIARGCP
jgi:hypothetical protein